MAEVSYYTEEGYKKLQEELKHYKTVKRAEIAKQIAEARDKGDLSENAEYDAAKDAQGMLELQISKMEEVIANARILEDNSIDPTKAYILSTVKILNHNSGKELKYKLVSESEADHKAGKISVEDQRGGKAGARTCCPAHRYLGSGRRCQENSADHGAY